MIRTLALAGALVALCVPAAAKDSEEFEESVKLSKGKATLTLTPVIPSQAIVSKGAIPRIGIGPSSQVTFMGYVGQNLDRSGKVSVVSAAQLGEQVQILDIDAMLDSEVRSMVAAKCSRGKLDFLLFVSGGTATMKASMIRGTRLTTPIEARLYGCKTRNIVWHQRGTLETSRSGLGIMFSGSDANIMGSREVEQRLSEVFARKFVADLNL